MNGFTPVPGTTAQYRGWSIWRTVGGSWAASDGSYNANGISISGFQSSGAIQAKIDALIGRPSPDLRGRQA